MLGLISLSQVFGQLWQGWVSDRVNIYFPTTLSALIPGLGALLLWGTAQGLGRLVPFVLIWGFFSASYSVLYTRMCSYLTDLPADIDANGNTDMLLYGFFSFERGVANIMEGPISSWLLSFNGKKVEVGQFALGRYGLVVWFTVVCMLVSSLAGLGWLWRPKPG